MKFKLLIATCLLAAVATCASGVSTQAQELAEGQKGVRVGFSPAKLFDFANYKTLFHKTYSGVLEELVRSKYFLSRAFRAFVSAIKYKYRKSRFYLAVNEMSDWTPEEIERSENKVLAETSAARIRAREAAESAPPSAAEGAKSGEQLPEMIPEDVEEVERELKRLTAEMSRLPSGQNERELPMEKLIETGAEARLEAEASRKLTNRVPGNNPDYKPLELQSHGLRDESDVVKFWIIRPRKPENRTRDFTSSLNSALNGIRKGLSRSYAGDHDDDDDEDFHEPGSQLPDEVFVDLRKTGCLTMPRQQGQCGSCWAFAAITIFEYLYCMKTGKLVPFSEQYMVDCGEGYVSGAKGCEGGTDNAPAHFVKNFGLELRINYPYNMRKNQCPYDEEDNLNTTGYLRFDFDHAVKIDLDLWADYIQNGPLWIAISLSPGFREYGGGVFGWGCDQKRPTHAVVLVGHGREDGEEYWLIRNSHSVGWGEGGYGKLAKRAGCAGERLGSIYATDDGRTITPKIRHNKLNDRTLIKNHYIENML